MAFGKDAHRTWCVEERSLALDGEGWSIKCAMASPTRVVGVRAVRGWADVALTGLDCGSRFMGIQPSGRESKPSGCRERAGLAPEGKSRPSTEPKIDDRIAKFGWGRQ